MVKQRLKQPFKHNKLYVVFSIEDEEQFLKDLNKLKSVYKVETRRIDFVQRMATAIRSRQIRIKKVVKLFDDSPKENYCLTTSDLMKMFGVSKNVIRIDLVHLMSLHDFKTEIVRINKKLTGEKNKGYNETNAVILYRNKKALKLYVEMNKELFSK